MRRSYRPIFFLYPKTYVCQDCRDYYHSAECSPILELLHEIYLPFCCSLVDAYTKVLQPTAMQRAYVESGRDQQQTLERCVHRWEFDREKIAKKQATLAAADADRVAFRSIDWHDFVVVEVRRFEIGDRGEKYVFSKTLTCHR